MSDWRVIDDKSVADPRLARAVDEFESLDNPLGRAATRWLREEAVANDGSTRTYALTRGAKLDGFFALSAAEVLLTRQEVADLNLPTRVRQPAILVAWIARAKDAPGAGATLLEAAYGKGRRIAEDLGAVALVVDPGDDAVAGYWMELGFRPSRPRWEQAPPRLWVPLRLAQRSDE